MKKSIIITESQYSNLIGKINEQEKPNLLFKTNYLPDQKAIEASYFLLSEKPNSFVVLNPKERLKTQAIWADGSQDYDLSFFITELPKSYVEIIGTTDSEPQFTIFKIPYWLYKKEPKLEVRRLEGKKRPTLSGKEEMIKKISDLDILDVFRALGDGFGKLKTYVDLIKNPTKPKPYEQPEKSSDPLGQPYNKPYWGD